MNNYENYFIKYPDSPHWWRWPQDGEMKVYNYLGGWHKINENSERWMNAKCIRTVDTWYQLYELTGYCPFEVDVGDICSEMWVSPEGADLIVEIWGMNLPQNIFLKSYVTLIMKITILPQQEISLLIWVGLS